MCTVYALYDRNSVYHTVLMSQLVFLKSNGIVLVTKWLNFAEQTIHFSLYLLYKVLYQSLCIIGLDYFGKWVDSWSIVLNITEDDILENMIADLWFYQSLSSELVHGYLNNVGNLVTQLMLLKYTCFLCNSKIMFFCCSTWLPPLFVLLLPPTEKWYRS